MRAGASFGATIPAAVVGLIVVAPYGYAYALNRATLGERLESDIQLYSATLGNYLATTSANVIHGGWSAQFGQSERFLFPGVLAIVLAALGLYAIDRRRVTLIAIGAIGFVISLGLNTPFYELLRAVVLPYRGLRAPARASILVFMALAALGAYGWTRLMRGRSKPLTTVATIVMAAALLVEFRTTMDRWLTVPTEPAEVYRWLAKQPRSVVAEVPFARADELHLHSRRPLHVQQHVALAADRQRLQRVLSEELHRARRSRPSRFPTINRSRI